jgi:hypothetical protein
MTPEELQAYLRAQHEEERRTLFGNEAIAIGMLQTVALAASIGLASQLGKIAALFGPMAASLMLSAFLLALALAVVATFFRHQYKMFGVKAPLGKDDAEKTSRNWWANFYPTAMRWLMGGATYLIAGAIVIGVIAM